RDDGLRLLLPSLHVGVEVGPASDVHAVGARVGLHHQRFLQCLRLQISERRESQHQPFAAFAFAALCRPLPPSTGLPSPPSHGGGTRVGSGHGISGKVFGPTLPSSPFLFAFSALKTFSGVIGTSSIRTPMASYTAFATAGGTGSSGPWPHSLAPKGPLGSGSSTT